METSFRFQRISQLWLLLSLICLGATFYLGYRYIHLNTHFLNKAKEQARTETTNAALKLDAFINILKPIAESIAKEVGERSMSQQELEQLLKNKKGVEISGLGVAFLPYKFDPAMRLYAPYYFEQDGIVQKIRIDEDTDYTLPRHKWFHRALKKGAGFIEPFYGETSKTILAEYDVPIYRVNKQGQREVIGVAFASQSIEHIKHILDTLFLDQSGYWTIVTKKGHFLSHPQAQLAHKRVTIFDLAKELDNPALAEVGKKITQQKSVFFEYNNEITGAPSWLFSEPIGETNWSIVGIFDKSELDIYPQELRRNLIYPSLSLVLFLIFFTFFIFSLFVKDNSMKWWLVITIISLALIGQVVWIWYSTYLYPEYQLEGIKQVKNKTDLHDYLKKETAVYRYGRKINDTEIEGKEEVLEAKQEALLQGFQNSRYVPTGIFINNLQFISANVIQMSAYVWQRFTKGIHDSVPRGFILPQATTSKIEEISRIQSGDTEIILYGVFAKLNQFLKFDNYPFDTKTLRIQLWHRYTIQNIVLVPDLDAYQLINPRSMLGLDNDVYLPGWNLVSSHFGYRKINYTSNFGAYAVGPFGIYTSVDKSEVPELYFEVLITRRLLDTLISDLLPIAVIAVLIFVILLTSVTQGFLVIGSLASVFFATIFSHLRFRGNIPPSEVVYFESFYFLMYAMILFSLVLSIVYTMEFTIPFIRYRQNMISKLIYWPLLFTALVLITLWYLF